MYKRSEDVRDPWDLHSNHKTHNYNKIINDDVIESWFPLLTRPLGRFHFLLLGRIVWQTVAVVGLKADRTVDHRGHAIRYDVIDSSGSTQEANWFWRSSFFGYNWFSKFWYFMVVKGFLKRWRFIWCERSEEDPTFQWSEWIRTRGTSLFGVFLLLDWGVESPKPKR